MADNNKTIKQACTGLTLIELIIVMVIVGIIIIGSSNLLQRGAESYFAVKNTLQNNWQNSIAIETMLRDLRNIRSSADIITASSSKISYTDINTNIISYNINSTGQLTKTLNNVTQILANNIPTLLFSYYDSNGSPATSLAMVRYIRIDLGAQNPCTTIYLWNFDIPK